MKAILSDAIGNRLPSFFQMKVYYSDDPRSLWVLRHLPTNKFIAFPTVRLIIYPHDPNHIRIQKVYPVDFSNDQIELKPKALEALRNLYKNPGKCWRINRFENGVQFIREGFLYPVDGWNSLKTATLAGV